jgi:hypothetical protein
MVTLAATEPARLLEIGLREAAHRALLHGSGLAFTGRIAGGRFLGFDAGPEPRQQFGERKTRWILHSAILRAGLAQIYLLHLALDDLGKKHFGLFGMADVALHGKTSASAQA